MAGFDEEVGFGKAIAVITTFQRRRRWGDRIQANATQYVIIVTGVSSDIILLQIADPPRDVPVAVRTEVIIPSTKNTERCDEIVRIVKKIITDKTHFDYICLFDMDKLTQYPH